MFLTFAMCVAEPQAVWYADLGGIESVLKDIRELVEYPLRHPEVRLLPAAAIYLAASSHA